MNHYLYYIIVASTLLVSCRSSKQEKTDDGHSSPAQEYSSASSLENASIAAGQCRIIGTVLTIDSVLDQTNPTSLCSKAPCSAFVRIDSVIGYGSSFPSTITTGNNVRVSFMFTLGPITLKVSEGKSESFPGLKEGNQFKADIRSQNAMNAVSFLIYGYKRL